MPLQAVLTQAPARGQLRPVPHPTLVMYALASLPSCLHPGKSGVGSSLQLLQNVGPTWGGRETGIITEQRGRRRLSQYGCI